MLVADDFSCRQGMNHFVDRNGAAGFCFPARNSQILHSREARLDMVTQVAGVLKNTLVIEIRIRLLRVYLHTRETQGSGSFIDFSR